MIEVKRKDRLLLVVRQADTQVHAYLNAREIYSKYGYQVPPFEDRIELIPQLTPGLNTLLVLGVRWEKNYRFDVEVLLNGDQIAHHQSLAPNRGRNQGIVWDFGLEFMLPG